MSITIIEPKTDREFEQYFLLRWEILRKPWNQPKHLAPVDGDDEAIHLMAVDERQNALAVCRLHFNTPAEAQVRFVAVSKEAQGKGVGKKIMAVAEQHAAEHGAAKMILHARENAVSFYKSIRYTLIEESYLLFDDVQHYLMEKEL